MSVSSSFRFFVLFLALIFLAGGKGADVEVPLKRMWALSGFKNPESVVLEPGEGVLYVSNVDGASLDKDGKGHISKVSLDGDMIEPVWIGGLNAPKGLAISAGKLYAADIDELVEIDLASRAVKRYTAWGAKFLNDVTVDGEGRVYVSDMLGDSIYRLDGGNFELWLKSADLDAPNGLYAEPGRLVVGAWGIISEGFTTTTPGHLKTVSLADKSVASLGDGSPVGNIDGVEADGSGNYFVTDWIAGALLRVTPQGGAVMLLDMPPGSADLEYAPAQGLVIIPLMREGLLVAYKVR